MEYQEVTDMVKRIIEEKCKSASHILIAIDGRCASGKTTLAQQLEEIFDCNVIHMDDFFLRPEQRTAERLTQPGENVDHERFLQEVLFPLREGKEFSYRPYDCSLQELAEPIAVFPRHINIVEGSYSFHNNLYEYYDLRLFLNVKTEEQMERILKRNGSEMAEVFRNKWIPMEELYFTTCQIAERSDYQFMM